MKDNFETNDFEKIKTAILILAQAIENGRIQGVCHDVTEALYPDSNVVNHSRINQSTTTGALDASVAGAGVGDSIATLDATQVILSHSKLDQDNN